VLRSSGLRCSHRPGPSLTRRSPSQQGRRAPLQGTGYRGAVSGPGGCGPAGLGNARRPTASAAASRACGVSSRFLRRRRSLAVCRWSSQATNGPSGRESPSRRPSTTSVQPGAGRAGRLDQAGALQLLLPVVGSPRQQASELDPVDDGVGAEAHGQDQNCARWTRSD
jgi:hypothetical protein